MKFWRSRCAVMVLALSSIAAVAVGQQQGAPARRSPDAKPPIKTPSSSSKQLVRVSLDKKPQPLPVAPQRRITASLDNRKLTTVGGAAGKRLIRVTLDDTAYLRRPAEAKPRRLRTRLD